MIAKIGTAYHEDWLHTSGTDERTQAEFLVTYPPVDPAAVAAEIRRVFASTSSPQERYELLVDNGGFVYGNLPDDPDDFLRSWLRAMEAASGTSD